MKKAILVAVFSGICIELIRFYMAIGPDYTNVLAWIIILIIASIVLIHKSVEERFLGLIFRYFIFLLVLEFVHLLILIVIDGLIHNISLLKVFKAWLHLFYELNIFVYVTVFLFTYFGHSMFIKLKIKNKS